MISPVCDKQITAKINYNKYIEYKNIPDSRNISEYK